jgi:hypothetical protein
MTDTTSRRRARRIELISPVTYAGKAISAVEIAPPRLDHVIRWGQGQITGSLTLLAELTGLSEGALRQLEYPDADDAAQPAFMMILPAMIRNDIGADGHAHVIRQPRRAHRFARRASRRR